MDYFWIRQDGRYDYVPIIENFRRITYTRNITSINASSIEDHNVVFSNTAYSQEYLDMIDRQLLLVSEKIKKVFDVYDNRIIYKQFCIINNSKNEFCKYYAPVINQIDAYSIKSEANLDISVIRKLVLNKSKILDYCIFKLSNIRAEVLIVRSDVAESILRRKVQGLQFIKAEIE